MAGIPAWVLGVAGGVALVLVALMVGACWYPHKPQKSPTVTEARSTTTIGRAASLSDEGTAITASRAFAERSSIAVDRWLVKGGIFADESTNDSSTNLHSYADQAAADQATAEQAGDHWPPAGRHPCIPEESECVPDDTASQATHNAVVSINLSPRRGSNLGSAPAPYGNPIPKRVQHSISVSSSRLLNDKERVSGLLPATALPHINAGRVKHTAAAIELSGLEQGFKISSQKTVTDRDRAP